MELAKYIEGIIPSRNEKNRNESITQFNNCSTTSTIAKAAKCMNHAVNCKDDLSTNRLKIKKR